MPRSKTGMLPAAVAAALALSISLAACGGGGGGGSDRGGAGAGAGAGAALPAWSGLLVGTGVRSITPTRYETFQDTNGDAHYQYGEPWFDTGEDRLWSWQEPGALGPDGQPGRAGADDDANGIVDDASEYLAPGSDDVPDPAGDDFGLLNFGGTERNGRFDMVPLAGFSGFHAVLAGGPPEFRPCQGVLDEIESRTIALSDGTVDLIIQSNDLVGMLHIDINPVKRRIEADFGVPFSNIIIASTHVHSSPDPIGLWAGTEFDADWLAEVRDRMYESARDAWLSRRPAIAKSATVEPPSAQDPLTLVLKRAPAVHIADQLSDQTNPANGYDRLILQTDLRDPVVRNTAIVAQRFDDPQTGAAIATLVNWHNHPEVMGEENPFITADFPGWVRRAVEARWGGTCIYLSGTVGGQIGALGRSAPVPLRDAAGAPVYQPGVFDANGNPVPQFVTDEGIDKARSIGFIVAEEAMRALDAQAYTPAPRLSVRTDDLDVDLENPAFQAMTFTIQNLRRTDPRDQPIRASHFVSLVGAVRCQIARAAIGDVELVTFPGEAPPEYLLGRRASVARYPGWSDYPFPAMPAIAAYMQGRDRMALSLANNYLGYLIPHSDMLNYWDTSHPNYYEEQVSAGQNFGDNCGNKLMQMLGAPDRFSNYPIRP